MFKIEIYGYGAEFIIGRLTEEQVKVIKEAEDIHEVIQDEDKLGDYYNEMDDVYHNYNAGAYFTIEVTDAEGNQIYTINSEDIIHNDECEIGTEYRNCYFEIDDPCLVTCAQEKGVFFTATVESEFDPSKLKIIFDDDCGLDACYVYGLMIRQIIYDGVELDDWGGSTVGKSFDAMVNF